METKLKVKLNNYNNAKKFNELANTFVSDIDIMKGRYIIDAKSLMGLFTLDLSNPIMVELHSEDIEEIERFIEVMKEFVEE